MHGRTFAKNRSRLRIACQVFGLSLCGSIAALPALRAEGPPPPAPTAGTRHKAPRAERIKDPMEADARRLADALGMPGDRREAALVRLRTAIASGKIAAFASNGSMNGIFAYQMGEGGFLVKVKKGKGLGHIVGESGDIALQLKSVTFGAQIGGGSEWGFGVILGLRNPAAFGGEYKGDNRGATAVEQSINITKLVKKGSAVNEESYHEIYMVGLAAGLSAGAAVGNLTITRAD
jgi:hypothetical protein